MAIGCARMGNPDGGWYDDDPPRVLGSTPVDRATGVTSQKITIYFDEYIKISDPSQSVIISPPQLEVPDIAAKGKKIVVELKDTLKPDMTYTIDFSDAISDNNEDNPLGNYTFTFSTGQQTDTLEVSGYVLSAENLDPVAGIMVGLYDDLADSAFRTKPLLRVSRTDANGHFIIRGVAEGEYRIYALQDADGNYSFSQKSEMIAFSHQTYKPYVKPDIRQDTIWRDSLHIDNIEQVNYMHYYPDDIVLTAFQETLTDRYLLKTERKDADRIQVFFSYGNEQLPVIHGLNFNSDDAFMVETSAKKDSITYWLRDTLLVNQDTLSFTMSYLMTDSLGQLVEQTDTIEALAKTPYAKRQKALQKEYETWLKQQEKKRKREEPYDSIYPVKPLQPRYDVPQAMDPDRSVFIELPTPPARIDTAGIHLYTKVDSLWYLASYELQQRDSLLRSYEMIVDWQPGAEYSFEVDSAAIVDIYGLACKPFKQGVRVKSLDDYATLFLDITGQPDSGAVVVQLLDKGDKVVATSKMDSDHTASFYYVKPGTYYSRAFIDLNENGVWDTGDYDADCQAEAVYYYPRSIETKAKFDISLAWNLKAKRLDQQKPSALVKKTAAKKRQRKNRNADRAAQLGIEYKK
jgi:uncharacterized protein (DUF2141 family)